MCLLLVAWRTRADLPVLLAANRDEAYDRPFSGPEAWRAGGTWVLAPRDLRAGGTWLGATARGLVVAITNRRDGDYDPARQSRGMLCRAALAGEDAGTVVRWLPRALARWRTNSFNLLVADRRRAVVASWNGALVTTALAPGVHVLSNEHGLGELVLPGLPADLCAGGDVAELGSRLGSFLGRHAPQDAAGFQVCKHGAAHGTVSAALVFLPASGAPSLHWAAGPPCRTAFVSCGFPAGTSVVP